MLPQKSPLLLLLLLLSRIDRGCLYRVVWAKGPSFKSPGWPHCCLGRRSSWNEVRPPLWLLLLLLLLLLLPVVVGLVLAADCLLSLIFHVLARRYI